MKINSRPLILMSQLFKTQTFKFSPPKLFQSKFVFQDNKEPEAIQFNEPLFSCFRKIKFLCYLEYFLALESQTKEPKKQNNYTMIRLDSIAMKQQRKLSLKEGEAKIEMTARFI